VLLRSVHQLLQILVQFLRWRKRKNKTLASPVKGTFQSAAAGENHPPVRAAEKHDGRFGMRGKKPDGNSKSATGFCSRRKEGRKMRGRYADGRKSCVF